MVSGRRAALPVSGPAVGDAHDRPGGPAAGASMRVTRDLERSVGSEAQGGSPAAGTATRPVSGTEGAADTGTAGATDSLGQYTETRDIQGPGEREPPPAGNSSHYKLTGPVDGEHILSASSSSLHGQR